MSFSLNLRRLTLINKLQNRILLSNLKNYSNAAANFYIYDKDPVNHFFNYENQKLMKSMTQLHLEKVFKRRSMHKNTVEIKFLTDKQLEQEVRDKIKKAEALLQMPPVMKQFEDRQKIISEDPALSGFSTSKFIFTDVTYGLKNSDRSIVIRHPEGVLQEAPFEVRKRIYQTYFPLSGRKMEEPKIFSEENLKRLLAENEFEFILSHCCLQFEPVEPRYHQITSQVYLYIDEHEAHNDLRSTRHFGPMAFFFSWHKIIDNLLRDMIRRDLLRNAVELICLMYKLNAISDDTSILKSFENINQTEKMVKDTIKSMIKKNQPEIKQIEKSNHDLQLDEICFEFIQDYVKNHSSKKGQLERTLQTYKERHNELKAIAEGVN